MVGSPRREIGEYGPRGPCHDGVLGPLGCDHDDGQRQGPECDITGDIKGAKPGTVGLVPLSQVMPEGMTRP